MKKIGYLIFAFIYYICRVFPIRRNQAFMVMTHDGSKEGNVGTVMEHLKQYPQTFYCVCLKREDTSFSGAAGIKKILGFFLIKPYELARSNYVFLDNIFLPMAYIRFPKKVSIVQLWHGTGTIKKFGQDVNTGELKQLEEKANQTITHLVVNSEYTKQLYEHVFQVPKEVVYTYGMPRTDILFNKEEQQKKLRVFYQEYPQLKEKKLLLYAPTFRDNEIQHAELKIQLDQLLSSIDKDYYIGLRLHPHVARHISYEGIGKERVIDFSFYENINTLLFASDCLITDYSSIIFEYCVLEKPMIFYAYDLEQFSKEGRGFYEPYEIYVPGPVAATTEDIIQIIKENKFDYAKIRDFREEAYTYTDGQSCKRLLDQILIERE